MKITGHPLTVIVALLALLSACGTPAAAPSPPEAPRASAPPTPARPPAANDAEMTERMVPARTPLFPLKVEPAPLAQRLCEVLHGWPTQRRAECCGTAPASGLLGECVRTLSSALADGTVTVDKRGVEACAADVEGELVGCDWITPLPFSAPESCRALIDGNLDVGAACRSSLECRAGLFCRGLGATAPGRCAAPVSAGAPCLPPVESLGVYTAQAVERRHPPCSGFCQAGRCQALAALGASCLSNVQCGPNAHCAGGRCVAGAHPPLGASCTGTTCGPGAACIDGRCAPRKASGAPCRGTFECRGACVKAAGAETGRCGMQCTPDAPLVR